MIEIEGYSFVGKVRMVWPIAAKIVSLTSEQIKEQMLCGVTERYDEYRRLPDPEPEDISHIVREIKAIAPDTIEVHGQFLSTKRGKEVLAMFEKDKGLAKDCMVYPNIYGLAAKRPDGTDDIEKETVCSVDILLKQESEK